MCRFSDVAKLLEKGNGVDVVYFEFHEILDKLLYKYSFVTMLTMYER